MSIYAPTVSGVSSILKSFAAKSRNSEQRVRFRLPDNVKKVLLDFTRGDDIKLYEELIYSIKDEQLVEDADLLRVLKEVRECISQLDMKMHHFIEALLSVNWTCRTEEIAKEYQGFVLDLLSAHNYYTKIAMEKLIRILRPGADEKEWANGLPSENEQLIFSRVHKIFRILLQVIPMSCEIFIQVVSSSFPYHNRPAHEQEAYVYNVLKITEYQPHLRKDFLFFIFRRLIGMDVHAPRNEVLDREDDCDDMDDDDETEIFPMDTNYENDELHTISCDKMKHPVADSLDVAMRQIFLYINSQCYERDKEINWEKTKKLYHDLISVFDQVILTTHATHHVQYLMFYLCSLKPVLVEGFLSFLWRKVINPSVAPVIRQSAVMYIGSLLSRASYINISLLKTSMAEMSSWIHKYITNQDGLERVNSDVRVHAVFYSVCQALFYVVAFRHKDFVYNKKNLTFLENLNLSKMVTCRLNPLKVCLPAVVQNFAAITRTYQLVYCYSVIEHNTRNGLPVIHQDHKGGYYSKDTYWLEEFFPFDPFVLKRCSHFIEPIYSIYQNHEEEQPVVSLKKDDDEEDDFLTETNDGNVSTLSEIFSYSSSPGFKKF